MPRRMPSGLLFLSVLCSALSIHAIGCHATDPAAQPILTGAGATFPAPLYRAWIDAFHRETDIRIGYEETGSGKGIQKLMGREVDFGATDAFLSDGESMTPAGRILHFPTCIGAVVVIYHLPGHPRLDLSPQVLSDLFLGRVERWDDPALKALNPGLSLPGLPPVVIHRSDSSGTSFIFTDFLTKTSEVWRRQVGAGKKVVWPAGLGVDGNGNLAEMVKKIPGSVGYVSMTYALQNRLPMAAIRNRSGRFILPSIASVSAAAQVPLPADARLMITDTQAAGGYPVSAFTYLIVHDEQAYGSRPRSRAEALAAFLHWSLTKGQSSAAGLHYAPLPAAAVENGLRQLTGLKWNGMGLWPQ